MRTLAGEDNLMHVSMTSGCSLSNVVGVDIAISNIEMFSAATGLQQRVRFALLQSYIIFLTVVDNISLNITNVFLYSCLIIQHAKLVPCTILHCHLWSVCGPPPPHYHTNCKIFGGKKFEYKIGAFIFPVFLVWIIFYSKNNSGTYYNKCTKVFRWTERQTQQSYSLFFVILRKRLRTLTRGWNCSQKCEL